VAGGFLSRQSRTQKAIASSLPARRDVGPRKLVFSEKPARKARPKTAERRGDESGPSSKVSKVGSLPWPRPATVGCEGRPVKIEAKKGDV